MKKIVSDFILSNPEHEINGFPISVVMDNDSADYCKKKITKMGEEADNFLIPLVSKILNISFECATYEDKVVNFVFNYFVVFREVTFQFKHIRIQMFIDIIPNFQT